MDITIECFGTFRNFGDEISLTAPEGASLEDLRPLLLAKLTEIDTSFDDEILARSRFATDTEVLMDTARLSANMRLAIIPPVSGG